MGSLPVIFVTQQSIDQGRAFFIPLFDRRMKDRNALLCCWKYMLQTGAQVVSCLTFKHEIRLNELS